MKNKEFYQETFSRLHSSTEIRWEAYRNMKRKRRVSGRVLVIAAVVAALAALSTAAVATDLFGFGTLLMADPVTVRVPDGSGGLTDTTMDAISLQGYSDSPESRAMAEWEAWREDYDRDGAIVAGIGNGPTGLDSRYDLYSVYTQEMAGKLDEIAAKYGLKLHSAMKDLVYDDDLFAEVGGNFMGPNKAYSAYMYEDGTFKFDGEMARPGGGIADIQFMRCVKGSLTDVLLTVGDASRFEAWEYTSACGAKVILALSPDKGLLIADLPDCFVSVNVLAGSEPASGGLTGGELEAFADSLDLTLLTPVKPPVMPDPNLPEEPFTYPEPENDPIYIQTGIQEEAAQAFYAQFVRAIEEDDRPAVTERLSFPVVLTDGGREVPLASAEDFGPYYELVFTPELLDSIHENQYTRERADLFAAGGMVGGANGAIWFGLLEDGTVQVVTVQNDDGTTAIRSAT